MFVHTTLVIACYDVLYGANSYYPIKIVDLPIYKKESNIKN